MMVDIRYPKEMKIALNNILAKASMTPKLRDAVRELRTAITKEQWAKASELSTVKSFISGNLKTSKYSNFGEDREYNEKKLGRDVYGLLDNINFNLSTTVGDLPSGMMVFTAEGIQTRKPKFFKSPTLALIGMERKQIEREAKKLRNVV
jgi:hypothetical protein